MYLLNFIVWLLQPYHVIFFSSSSPFFSLLFIIIILEQERRTKVIKKTKKEKHMIIITSTITNVFTSYNYDINMDVSTAELKKIKLNKIK